VILKFKKGKLCGIKLCCIQGLGKGWTYHGSIVGSHIFIRNRVIPWLNLWPPKHVATTSSIVLNLPFLVSVLRSKE